MTWQVALVQAGRLEQHEHDGKPWETAIYKRPIAGPVAVQKLGVVGDEHTGDTPDPDRAVCVHSAAHYDF